MERVNITLGQRHIKALDEYAESIGLNRSEVIRSWIIEKLILAQKAHTHQGVGTRDALAAPKR